MMLWRVLVSVLLPILLAVGESGQSEQEPLLSQPRPKRVAIIGAGAAGASTAYFLRNLTLNAGIPLSITVYEKNDYVGGRSTTVNAFDLVSEPVSEPVELGASIFVSVNHNLVNAVRDFSLPTTLGISGRRSRVDASGQSKHDPKSEKEHEKEDDDEDEDSLLGIWDGAEFVYTQPTGTPSTRFTKWYRSLRLLYHYGLAPIRILRLVNSTIRNFLNLYTPQHFPFPDLTGAVQAVGLTDAMGASGWDVLQQQGLTSKFAWEVVQAATRVNYASGLEGIHGMGMLVSMATDGAMAVEGGNWQIFDNMIVESGADLRLGTVVEHVRKSEKGGYVVGTRPAALAQVRGDYGGTEDEYDEVVLAAPIHQSDIDFPTGTLSHIPANDTYRTLHVTLFSSPHRLSRRYFNLTGSGEIPTTVLTTLPGPFPSASEVDNETDEKQRTGELPFYSISTLRSIINPHTGTREYLYKVFSPAPFSNDSIAALMDPTTLTASTSEGDRLYTISWSSGAPQQDPGWIYRKTWLSYPILKPRVSFEPLRLDVSLRNDGPQGSNQDSSSSGTDHGPAGGIWYTSSMEGFISTMETASLMGANVARLMVDGWTVADGDNNI